MPTARRRKRDINAVEKVVRALALRKQGLSYDRIAAECGYSDRGSARNAIMSELNRVPLESAEELRTLELQRMDEMLAALWPLATRHQEIPAEDDDVATVKEKMRGPDKFAVDRVLGIMDRRARLLGLDMTPSAASGAGQTLIREYGVDISQV